MPSNTGRLSVKLEGFSTTKKPSPLIAIKVPMEADWTSPCTVLVMRELATTLPASCFVGVSSGRRSTKLVSIRLNAVVCELAIFPETFSSAKDCARIPDTAVLRAPKIPMASSPTAFAATLDRNIETTVANPVPIRLCKVFRRLEGTIELSQCACARQSGLTRAKIAGSFTRRGAILEFENASGGLGG